MNPRAEEFVPQGATDKALDDGDISSHGDTNNGTPEEQQSEMSGNSNHESDIDNSSVNQQLGDTEHGDDETDDDSVVTTSNRRSRTRRPPKRFTYGAFGEPTYTN